MEEWPPNTEETLADAGVHAPRDPGWMLLSDVGVGASVRVGPSGIGASRDELPDAEVSAEMVARVRAEQPTDPLTPREVEVLDLMAGGRTNREVAQGLSISPGTVRSHVQNIIAKLGVSDRTGAVVRGIELGVIQTSSTRRGQ